MVKIQKIELSQPGFVVVQEIINEKPGQILEVSQYLNAGTYENIPVLLTEKRQSKMTDIRSEFPIVNQLIVIVYEDDGDQGFNPNIDSILEENGNVFARYIESGDKVPRSIITPRAQEQSGTAAVIVMYTEEGFSPEIVEIKQGATVEFMNISPYQMWVATNSHPAHDILPTFDQFTSSDFKKPWQYTFDQKGAWRYHDHINASMEGLVIVK